MTRSIHLIVGPGRGRFPSSNCLLIKSSPKTVLVDAGCGRDNILAVRDRVDAVLYTHIHPDHIAHHELLRGKETYMPIYDAQFQTLEELAKRFAPPIWRDWIDYVQRVFSLKTVPIPTATFEPWETVRIGAVEIEAIPAHGHTRGHHVLLIGSHAHISDIDLTGFGPWYGHPESSLTAFIADMDMVAGLDAKTYTTSHKEYTYTRDPLLEELSRYRKALDRQITSVAEYLGSIGGEARPGDLVDKGLIYRRKLEGVKTVMDYFERKMIEEILDYLAAQKILAKTVKGYKAITVSGNGCSHGT